jgi:hypothetical protein
MNSSTILLITSIIVPLVLGWVLVYLIIKRWPNSLNSVSNYGLAAFITTIIVGTILVPHVPGYQWHDALIVGLLVFSGIIWAKSGRTSMSNDMKRFKEDFDGLKD